MERLRGRLLVATPAIEGGPFLRSVVYVLDHDEDGALGVIVNHPLDADVDDVLPAWGSLVNAPVCLFDGGPVAMDSALAVGVLNAPEATPAGWRPMAGRVGLVDLAGPLPDDGQLVGMRVFAGYAGWSAGQLESEIEEGSWVVVDAEEGDLLSPQPEELWRHVLRRQEDDLRLWATLPADPNVN
ncbi:YqgE/AlgH family protein [Aeromicrobium sp. CTD01-1L150]|uniref:YqgE/AlgH family protein n=1 Tax=Aeromicrobium sp. CTD01-1L150 TaxID=3341830 RepID=UPI0035C1903B